ncbi:MAG: hypothetical protein AAF773_11090 [Cyanobacteria bacterium P01_D01_bin.115]
MKRVQVVLNFVALSMLLSPEVVTVKAHQSAASFPLGPVELDQSPSPSAGFRVPTPEGKGACSNSSLSEATVHIVEWGQF